MIFNFNHEKAVLRYSFKDPRKSLLLRKFAGPPLFRGRGAQVSSLQASRADSLVNACRRTRDYSPVARAGKDRVRLREEKHDGAIQFYLEKTMQYEEILTTITSSNPTSCLEVAVCTGPQGKRKVELRRLWWGEGVGWYCQQSLRLDPSEAEGLLEALKGNRRRWGDRPLSFPGKVIPFPVPRASQTRQRVHPFGKVREKRTSSPLAELPVAAKRRVKRGEDKAATSRV
jgi:hypothetical protein